MEDVNDQRLKEGEQCLHPKKVAIDEPLVKEEIGQLKEFLLSKER